MVFPYNTWNYAHNRNYLSYVQEQLGLVSEAVRGARELLAVPLDPKLNDKERFSPHWQGLEALTRALVRFERWDEILDRGRDPVERVAARSQPPRLRRSAGAPRQGRSACRGGSRRRAQRAQGGHRQAGQRLDQAGIRDAGRRARGTPGARTRRHVQGAGAARRRRRERAAAAGRIRRSAGLSGHWLRDAGPRVSRCAEPVARARRIREGARRRAVRSVRARGADPGAIRARRTRRRRKRRMRGFASSGRTPNPGCACWTDVQKLGLTSAAKDASPGPQRNYRRERLDAFGPAIWAPNPAPALDVRRRRAAAA